MQGFVIFCKNNFLSPHSITAFTEFFLSLLFCYHNMAIYRCNTLSLISWVLP